MMYGYIVELRVILVVIIVLVILGIVTVVMILSEGSGTLNHISFEGPGPWIGGSGTCSRGAHDP